MMKWGHDVKSRRDQDARAAELSDAPSHAPSIHPPADRRDQCDPRPSCRVWNVAPVGRNGVEELFNIVADPIDKRVPEIARACLAALGAQLDRLKEQILEFDRIIITWQRSNEASRRLDAIPRVGPALSTALVVSIADPKAFRSGRNFSAWFGLVPKQHSSGAHPRRHLASRL